MRRLDYLALALLAAMLAASILCTLLARANGSSSPQQPRTVLPFRGH